MIFTEHVKNTLLSFIQKMAAVPWLFSKNPGTDFSRSRKLDFASTILILFSMEIGSLQKELLDHFRFSADTPSASTFSQQRAKLISGTFPFLFYAFNSHFPLKKRYREYRLLACDGSDLNIARNPEDTDSYFHSLPSDKKFNQLHLNALYDLCKKQYTNAMIQPARKK